MIELFRSALRNLIRKRMRTGLTVASIAIGIASVVIIGAIGDSGKLAVSAEMENMGLGGLLVSASTSTDQSIKLRSSDLEAIRQIPTVEDAMPIVVYSTRVSLRGQQSNSIVWGIDAGANQVISLNLLHGRIISRSDIQNSGKVCMVDQNFAKEVYGRENIVGKELEVLIQGQYETFEIVGIVEAGSSILQNVIGNYAPSFVYVPYSSLQQGIGQDKFDQIAIKVDNTDQNQVDQTADSIVSTLDEINGVDGAYETQNLAKQKDRLSAMMDIVTWILSAIGAISLLVAGLGIMTIMLVSVTERTREIGIKKAIGARSGLIWAEFLIEAICLTAIGSIVGASFGLLVSFVGAGAIGLQYVISMPFILGAVGFSMLTGIIFGVYPAIKASRLKPVDALRRE
ncbi:ABC transporter permease [Solibaculum mannosilyticum]|uniref:ABC transporter permease n=1 Tax=Solibaculum mannosilyticum TaxID=2780922 RepID=UPI000C07CC73|nr:ABC transporter permease [[Clostridium] leptum]